MHPQKGDIFKIKIEKSLFCFPWGYLFVPELSGHWKINFFNILLSHLKLGPGKKWNIF